LLGKAVKCGAAEVTQAKLDVMTMSLGFVANLLVDDAAQVREAASESLVALTKLFPEQEIQPQTLTILLGLAHSDDSEEHRIMACELFEQVAPVLGRKLIETFVIKEYQNLSQDPQFKVRKALALSINALAIELGPGKAEDHVLPIVMGLASDSIWSVRKGIADILPDLSKSMPEAVRNKTVMDLCKSFLKDESRWVRKAMFANFGPFIVTLPSDVIGKGQLDMIKLYTSKVVPATECDDKDLFISCAYNLPALAQQLGPKRWEDYLYEAFKVCLDSEQWKVRRALAFGLHEIAKVLGPDTVLTDSGLNSDTVTMPAFFKFIDDVEEVKLGILNTVAKYVACVGEEKPRLTCIQLIQEHLPIDAFPDWRLREILAGQMVELCGLFPAELVQEYLVPICMKLWTDEVVKVRDAASAIPGALFNRMRGFPAWENEIMTKVIMSGRGGGWTNRQRFARTCKEMAVQVPMEVFIEKLLQPFLRLKDDRVPNVRLALANALENCLGLDDLIALPEVSACAEQLTEDEDTDVREAVMHALEVTTV